MKLMAKKCHNSLNNVFEIEIYYNPLLPSTVNIYYHLYIYLYFEDITNFINVLMILLDFLKNLYIKNFNSSRL